MIYKKVSSWFSARPILAGVIFFFILFTLNALIVIQRYQLFKDNKKQEISNILDGVEKNINQSIKNSYNVALTLGLTVNNDGIPIGFESIAEKLIKSNPEFQAVQLVPNGVIKYLYPIKGNEGALNVDLFKSLPITQYEMRKAIDSRKMYFQGPVKLNQGGMGIVGRMPMFINDKFWGFSAVVIKLDMLFSNAGIDNSKYKDYKFQFSKINGITKKEEFFIPFNFKYLKQESNSVFFTDGDWKLSVINIKPYNSWLNLLSAVLFGVGISILSSYLLTRLLLKQAKLVIKVNDQTTKLIDTESKFKNIFDHSPIGIAKIDSKTGQILQVNQYLCDFLGYDETELINTKIKTLIYHEDLEEDRIVFKTMLEGKIRKYTNEKRYIKRNGDLSWSKLIVTPLWNEGEEPTNHVLILEDITQRKVEERILTESQKRIESLINTIDGIVWEGDPLSKKCTFVSNKIFDILGYTPNEWLSDENSWSNHLHADDKEKLFECISDAFKYKKSYDIEYRMFAKDGGIVWIRDIVSIVNEISEPLKLRGIMLDITSKIYSETALTKSFKLVTEQNKRLLNFSYIVSHNLRSHASNILGISTLIETAKNTEDRNEMIQLLKTVASNLNETLYNLNNIVNIQTSIDIVIEPLNLSEYVLAALSMQNLQILSREAKIINNIDENVKVNFNKAYLESILLNLISNALRYSSIDRKPVITLTCFEEDNQVLFKISDNGIGIDLNKHGDKMFGIYQTFNGNADARGFGLFISKNQIEAMGGKIEVESDIGKGTAFKIYFKS